MDIITQKLSPDKAPLFLYGEKAILITILIYTDTSINSYQRVHMNFGIFREDY